MFYYKAVFADDNMEIIMADSNRKAIKQAREYESEHGELFNVFILDENYYELETIF